MADFFKHEKVNQNNSRGEIKAKLPDQANQGIEVLLSNIYSKPLILLHSRSTRVQFETMQVHW